MIATQNYELKVINRDYGETSLVPTAKEDLKKHQVYREIVVEDNLPSMVNAVGYVDPNKRIKQMVEAGIRIDAWNQAVYDYENGFEDDDGVSMASDREDWDSLDGLSEGAREKALYEREMYRYYLDALKTQSASQKASQAPSEANVKQSVTPEKADIPDTGKS